MERNKIRLIVAVALTFASYQAYTQAVFPPITINLSYPQYQRLRSDGGYAYIEGGGLRGIILYREGENSFRAYERACPHHPEENCAVVQVDMSSLYLVDRCCKSTFNFSDGQPTGGPAERPLLQYRIEMTGNILKISDEIIN